MSIYRVIDITCHRIVFTGSEKECKAYKRKHYDRFTRIYFSGEAE